MDQPPLAFDAARLTGLLASLAWPFLRISGLLLVAPVFGANVVPPRVKMAFAVMLTIIVAPLAPPPAGLEPLSAAGLLVALEQVLVGIVIGFVVQLLFDVLVMAGQTIAMTMGLGFATLVDPSRGGTTPVLSQFFLIMGLLLFLALDGHLALIGVLVDSFRFAPVGESVLTRDGLWLVAGWGGRIFEYGLMIALPAVVALLVVNLAMGVVSRAAPQLNLFAVGFPVAMLFGFVVLLLSLPALRPAFSGLLGDALAFPAQVLGAGR